MINVPPVSATYQTLTNPHIVAANRQGIVTAEQRASLERAARAPIWLGLIVSLMFAVASLLPTLGALGIFAHGHVNVVGLICSTPCALVAVLFVGLAFVAPISTRRRNAAIATALRKGTIAQTEGSVIFSRGGYRADADGQRLRTSRGEPLALRPGRYRFYYLPQPPILLSAEPLDTPTPAFARPPAIDPLLGLPGYTPPPAPDGVNPYITVDPTLRGLLDALAESNRFTIEELSLNRGGHMSGRQARRLAVGLIARLFFALGFIVSGVTPIILSLIFRRHATPALRTGAYVGVFFGLVGVIILVVSMRRIADIIARRAVAIEGWVESRRNNSGESTTYNYEVSGKRFQVGGRAYLALVPGIYYRVYYAPRCKELLSIEPLAAPAGSSDALNTPSV